MMIDRTNELWEIAESKESVPMQASRAMWEDREFSMR